MLHAIPQKNPDQPERETAPSVDGEFYRLTIDPSKGAVTSLVEKTGGCELLAAPANVVSRETDKGDLWELYQGLDGGSAIAMKRKQPVPRAGQAKLTSEFHGPPQKLRRVRFCRVPPGPSVRYGLLRDAHSLLPRSAAN